MNPADCQAKSAEADAREALGIARSAMQSALEILDRHIDRYEEADGLKDKADVLNWTILLLASYVAANVRLDQLARAQAELARADLTR
jgi:hypothetical protein